MGSDRQYLAYGLLIGILIAAVLMAIVLIAAPRVAGLTGGPPTLQPAELAGALPTDPASIPAATPTFTPIPPSAVPINIAPGLDLAASPTPDAVLSLMNRGGLIFTGPLTNPLQVSLYRASIAYAQTTVADSKRVSKEINGVGDPTNICGPLAIAVLRDAGIIASDVKPYDFWLLNPRTVLDQRKIVKVFPPAQFVHTFDSTPLNKVDWKTSPLEPGDFMFIWHGSGGNFDHMLVVNRVDSQARAYAVTNFGTPDGYIIAETMLYDPNDPKAGIFHTWTQVRDQILGSTGFGGYELWRTRGP